MKVIIFVLIIGAVFGAQGGVLSNEKEEAKEIVNKKYDEVKASIIAIGNKIVKEGEEKDNTSKEETEQFLDKKLQENLEKIKKQANEVTRTAIAKGKPIQVIECIGKTLIEGEASIFETKIYLDDKVKNVLSNKLKVLKLLEIQLNLISDGLKVLKEQALKKIEESKVGFEALKLDALKKFEFGAKQLHEIEIRITKPLLSDEYMTVKKQGESKFKETSDIIEKKLQKCIA